MQTKQNAVGAEEDHPYGWQLRTVILENLTVAQLVNKFIAFYETRSFKTVSTRGYHSALHRDNWIQSTPSLILSSLPIGYFRLGFLTTDFL